ncbi:MAG: YicC family protein [Lentisphaeria bacterium]|nr:YicC family protein [Lentisphaeria bacterium]
MTMLSMTGFGKAEAVFDGRFILTAEVGSVNRKQLEVRCSLPQECGFFEERVRKIAARYISRGAVQVRMTIHGRDGGVSGEPVVNSAALESLVRQCAAFRRRCGLDERAVDAERLLTIPGIVIFQSVDPDSPELAAALEEVLVAAFEKFRAMREVEGENLKADLFARLEVLKELLGRIEPAASGIPGEMKKRLLAKLSAEKIPVPGSEEQLLREVLFYADRADVTEEITRLKSHFAQFTRYMNDTVPGGRSLDFLAQEMFREINTLGNKAGIPAVSALVVEFKSTLEKIREQIQNVE